MINTKIVIIEDHENLRLVQTQFFESQGFSVTALECAEDYDDDASAHGANIYIVDLTLPGEDGLTFVKRLREGQPHACIIVTTARSELEDRITGYKTGANVYLPKPVDPFELLAIVQSNLNATGSMPQCFELNVHDQKLLLPESTVQLSLSETRMLAGLISAKDNVLEAWQLIALTYPNRTEMPLVNFQMRVSRLRNKLRDAGIGHDVIRSERGFGYRLCVKIIKR